MGGCWVVCLLLTSSALAFDLQGHRGARGLAPENTLPAFVRALSLGVTALELDTAITNAGASMRSLKATAAGAAETLDDRLARARTAIDELSLLTASGERIAERFDRVATQPAATRAPIKSNPNLPSGSIMGRLDALRAVR